MLALNISKWSNKDGTKHLFKNIPKYNAKKKSQKYGMLPKIDITHIHIKRIYIKRKWNTWRLKLTCTVYIHACSPT